VDPVPDPLLNCRFTLCNSQRSTLIQMCMYIYQNKKLILLHFPLSLCPLSPTFSSNSLFFTFHNSTDEFIFTITQASEHSTDPACSWPLASLPPAERCRRHLSGCLQACSRSRHCLPACETNANRRQTRILLTSHRTHDP
jgi:hypothetical protein